jgi:hypothetical protein
LEVRSSYHARVLLNFARYPDIDKEESWNPKGITFKIKDDALAIQFKLRFQI